MWRRPLCALMGAALTLTLWTTARADTQQLPCRKLGRGDTVKLDFHQTPLAVVARTVSCLVGVNLMFQPTTLRTKPITVISSRPIDRPGVWALFSSALRHLKLRVERRDAFYVIVES